MLTLPEIPIKQKMDEFEEEYKRLITDYLEVRKLREEKEAKLTFDRSGVLLQHIKNGSKITESERMVSTIPEFYEIEKEILDLKRNEKGYEMYQHLMDHKANFLTSLCRLVKAELEKTALKP